jgi:hypothetical protein
MNSIPMKTLTTLLFLFLLTSCNRTMQSEAPVGASDTTTVGMAFDTLAAVKTALRDFPSEEVYQIYKGDLDGDTQEDLAVITETVCDSLDKNGLEDSRCRTLFLLTTTQPGAYAVRAKNKNLIGCNDCGGASVGDPFEGLVIGNGQLMLYSRYGACMKTAVTEVFAYAKKENDWFLKEKTTADYSCTEANADGSVKVETRELAEKDFGKVTFESYIGEL